MAKNGIEHPQSTGWLYLHVPRAGEIGHTAASLLVGGAFSSSTCSCLLASIIVSTYLLPVHFCIQYLIKWTVYLRILRIPHYDVMVGWLVRWLRQKGGLRWQKSELWPRGW